MIPIYRPYLPPQSLQYAHDALDSTWLSSQGKYLTMAQEKLQELLGAKYVLPLNNGTSACHLMAKTLHRVCPPLNSKKEIIVPNNVYAAAWNGFLFDNNYTLIPVETDLDTWNVDLNLLDQTINQYPNADVLIVHNVGNIINVPALQQKYPRTHFVEDNCEGFLGTYNGKQAGTAGYVSAISFFGNKNITSGEGGALVTDFEDAYLYAKCLHSQGQSSKRFVHSDLGYNYRMTNIQAAILCGQLEVLPEIMEKKNHIFHIYRHAFSARHDVMIQDMDFTTTHSNWMFGLRLPGTISYDHAEMFFKGCEVEIRPMFYSIKAHKHLQNNPDILDCDDTNANLLNKECIILPSFPELTEAEVHHIIQTVNNYIGDTV
jgi:perosamine synthetase